MKQSLFFIFVLVLGSNCEVGNNDKIFKKLNEEFTDSIEKK